MAKGLIVPHKFEFSPRHAFHYFIPPIQTIQTMRKPFLQLALAKAKGPPPKPFQTTLTANSSWPFSADRPASTTRPTRIAVLDSSFNPPTKAHYHLLKAASRVGCDAVLLLLATNNVDKGQTGASAVERLEMMEALAMDAIRNEKDDPAVRHMAVGLTVRTELPLLPTSDEHLYFRS